MEKQAAEDGSRGWQWQGTNGDALDNSFVEAAFWPCGSYSRTWARLRAALAGRDAVNIPQQGCYTPDCAQYGFCIPFYGCLLAKLQTTVRSFYGINGSDFGDWIDGCCCPCLTLVRAEDEILYREKQRRLPSTTDTSPSVTDPYHSPTPMDSSSSSDPDGGLSTIPEDSCATVTIVRAFPHRLSEDPKIPVTAENTRVHYLDQDWYLVPAKNKENRRRSMVDDVIASSTKRGPVSPRMLEAHSLEQDRKANSGQAPVHGIHDDQALPQQPSPIHAMRQDRLAPTYRPAGLAPHDMHQDEAYRTAASTPHGLRDDHPSPFERPTVAPHDLGQDRGNPPTVTTPHGIQQDRANPSNVKTSHALETDGIAAQANIDEILAHSIEIDAPTSVERPRAHKLGEHRG